MSKRRTYMGSFALGPCRLFPPAKHEVAMNSTPETYFCATRHRGRITTNDSSTSPPNSV
jgi:hypothetical protein